MSRAFLESLDSLRCVPAAVSRWSEKVTHRVKTITNESLGFCIIVVASLVIGGTTDTLVAQQSKAGSVQDGAKSEQQKSAKTAQQPSTAEKKIIRTVSGRIVDSNGEAVPNVHVLWTPSFRQVVLPAEQPDRAGNFKIEFTTPKKKVADLSTWFYSSQHSIRIAQMSCLFSYGSSEDISESAGNTIPLPDYEQIAFQVLEPWGAPMADAVVKPYHVALPNGVYMADDPTGLYGFVPEEISKLVQGKTDSSGYGVVRSIPRQHLNSVAVVTRYFGTQIFKCNVRTKDEVQVLKLKETCVIEGQVLLESPEQLADTKVSLGSSSSFAETKVDSEGKFKLRVPFDVSLSLNFDWNDELDVLPVIPDLIRFQQGESQALQIETAPAVTVKGIVQTADSKLPIAGAKISLSNADRTSGRYLVAVTDENGEYVGKVLPGRLRRHVFAYTQLDVANGYEYPRTQGDVLVPQGVKVHQLEPLLSERRHVISGKVVGGDGEPIPNLSLAVKRPTDRHNLGVSVTDAQGNFAMSIYNWQSHQRDFDNMEWSVRPAPSEWADPIPKPLERVVIDPDKMLLRLSSQEN